MLGAMNSKLISLKLRFYYNKILTFKVKRAFSNVNNKLHNYNKNKNKDSNGTSNFDPNNKNKWKEILGIKGIKKHAFELANEHIKNKKVTNSLIINDILSYSGIKVTEDQLNELKSYPGHLFDCSNILYLKNEIKNIIGLVGSKKQIPGVYIFTHKKSGSKYVGSSSQLAIRLNGYFFNKHKVSGLFIPLLKKKELSNFLLYIIPLNKSNLYKPEIILEQYYLLDPTFNLNTIKVANNPSGNNSKSIYMYNRDKSILYSHFTKQINIIKNLNIHHSTLLKHLKNNTYYLGKYSFSRELNLNAKVLYISLLDLSLKLENDRKTFNKNKPLNSLSRSVIIENRDNKKDVKLFFSLNKCITFFKDKGHRADQRMLIKSINSNTSYFGYYCKYI